LRLIGGHFRRVVPAVLRCVSLLDQGHYSGCHWTSTAVEVGQWWAHLVGALRVHPHKHDANDPRKKIEDLREARAHECTVHVQRRVVGKLVR
jgi:hypothetical protein